MAFLFGRNKQRSAQDLVRSVKDSLQRLVKEEGQISKVRKETRDRQTAVL